SLLGLLLLASTCALAPTAPMEVEERTVSPVAANPAITQFTDDHYVWLPAHLHDAGDRIMLLLPGTGGRPANARLIGAMAAEQGYRAIGLMYVDDRAVVNECAADPDMACMANM